MSETKAPRENLLVNLVFSFALPTLILTKFSGDKGLGPLWGLVVALSFPIGYTIWDFAKRRQANFLAIVGFVSVLLSGSLGLVKADGFWFAVKDAAMPIIIGSAVLISLRTRQPLVRTMFINEQLMDVEKVEASLAAKGNQGAFEALLRKTSLGVAASFFVTSLVSFTVARHIIVSPPGTEAFNQELGRMHWLGTLIIIVPNLVMMMTVLWRLFLGLEKLTGLTQDEILTPKKS